MRSLSSDWYVVIRPSPRTSRITTNRNVSAGNRPRRVAADAAQREERTLGENQRHYNHAQPQTGDLDQTSGKSWPQSRAHSFLLIGKTRAVGSRLVVEE